MKTNPLFKRLMLLALLDKLSAFLMVYNFSYKLDKNIFTLKKKLLPFARD